MHWYSIGWKTESTINWNCSILKELSLLVQSAFILRGTLNENLDSCKTRRTKEFDEFWKKFVHRWHDLWEYRWSRSQKICKQQLSISFKILLHKWHFNFQELGGWQYGQCTRYAIKTRILLRSHRFGCTNFTRWKSNLLSLNVNCKYLGID